MFEVLYNGNYFRLKKLPARIPLEYTTNAIISHALISVQVNNLAAPTLFTVGDSTFKVTRRAMWPGYITIIVSLMAIILIALGYAVSIEPLYIAGLCAAATVIPFGCVWITVELIKYVRGRKRTQMAVAV